jgi:hypothetical protein
MFYLMLTWHISIYREASQEGRHNNLQDQVDPSVIVIKYKQRVESHYIYTPTITPKKKLTKHVLLGCVCEPFIAHVCRPFYMNVR